MNELEKLRIYSLQVIDNMEKLTKQIVNINSISKNKKPISIPITYNGKSYLASMKTDTNFLSESIFAKWFNLSSKPDPFLLGASSIKY